MVCLRYNHKFSLVQKIKDNTSCIDKSVKKALDTGNKEWR